MPSFRPVHLTVLLLSTLVALGAYPSPALAGPAGGPPELLVGFAPHVTPAQAEAIYRPLGAERLEVLPGINVHRVRVPEGRVATVTAALAARPEVRFVEQNQRLAPQGGPVGTLPDELLIGIETDGERGANAEVKAMGGAAIERIHGTTVQRVQVPAALLDAAEQSLLRMPGVQFVERHTVYAPSFVPNDTSYSSSGQWHLRRIQAPQAWDITRGSSTLVIAILDTGVDGTHPDLAAKMVPGYNFYSNNTNTADVHGHGTKVAGVAAATGDNLLGVVGVAMQSRIMPVRVSDPGGYAYASTIANGITWATDRGAKVINISFGGIAGSNTVRSAAQYAYNRGTIVVAGAGNCGCTESIGQTPYILSVSGTTSSDVLASFSSRGNYVDLAAPAAGILTTTRGGGYGLVSGTSFSGPIVAGVIALMKSANPALTTSQLSALIRANADDLGAAGWDPLYGDGRVNAYRAVAAARGSTTTTTITTTTTTTTTTSTTCPGSVVIDNLAPGRASTAVRFTGTWTTSSSSGYYGSNGSLYSSGGGSDTYTWSAGALSSTASCTYDVYVWWTNHPNRSSRVPISVTGHTGGSTQRTFDQRTGGGRWVLHGRYTWSAGRTAAVTVSDANGQAAADAVKLVRVTTLADTDAGVTVEPSKTVSTGGQ